MSSVRQQIMTKILEQINAPGKPSNMVAGRAKGLLGDLVNKPETVIVTVKPAKEEINSSGGQSSYAAERDFYVLIEIECAAAAGETPDQTADPIHSWIVKQLTANGALGPLSHAIREKEIVWTTEEGDDFYGRSHWLWIIEHATVWNDQERPM